MTVFDKFIKLQIWFFLLVFLSFSESVFAGSCMESFEENKDYTEFHQNLRDTSLNDLPSLNSSKNREKETLELLLAKNSFEEVFQELNAGVKKEKRAKVQVLENLVRDLAQTVGVEKLLELIDANLHTQQRKAFFYMRKFPDYRKPLMEREGFSSWGIIEARDRMFIIVLRVIKETREGREYLKKRGFDDVVKIQEKKEIHLFETLLLGNSLKEFAKKWDMKMIDAVKYKNQFLENLIRFFTQSPKGQKLLELIDANLHTQQRKVFFYIQEFLDYRKRLMDETFWTVSSINSARDRMFDRVLEVLNETNEGQDYLNGRGLGHVVKIQKQKITHFFKTLLNEKNLEAFAKKWNMELKNAKQFKIRILEDVIRSLDQSVEGKVVLQLIHDQLSHNLEEEMFLAIQQFPNYQDKLMSQKNFSQQNLYKLRDRLFLKVIRVLEIKEGQDYLRKKI